MAPRLDFYTYIHKSLRRQSFHLVLAAAGADFADEASVDALAATFSSWLEDLRAHGHHEDAFLHPVLARHVPAAAARLGNAHEDHEAALAALEAAFSGAHRARSPELGAAFARELQRFVGVYLLHLAEEEDLNPTIATQVPADELAAAMGAFEASRSPDATARDLEHMLPALNRQDRVAILTRLKETAPPAFIFVMDIARRVLDARSLLLLETDLGVESSASTVHGPL